MNQKRVILLNIDSLMPHTLEIATQSDRASALKFLMEHGYYSDHLVSAFPTMSVTIDSTLLTGTYADQHHIPGLNWFDRRTEKIHNYGTGFKETLRIGIRQTAHNMLYRLNNEHLNKNVTTIYESLAERGLPSASINSFVYRGNTPNRLRVPKLLSTLTHFEDGEWHAYTPQTFSLGSFSKLRKFSFPTQIAAGNRTYTARELRYLIRKQKLPTFTFCIFQDMDLRLHFKSPLDIKGITKIDQEIQKILNMYPSWQAAIEQNIWIIIGDNGHSTTGRKRKEVAIDLRKIFKAFTIAKVNRPIRQKDELFFSVNQRMAYIYPLQPDLPLRTLVSELKKDPRIDIIAWKNNDGVSVASGVNRGELFFKPSGKFIDMYGQSWHIEGNFVDLLDITYLNECVLTYGIYPDAFARLYGAVHSHEGRFLVVNAKPGYEFQAQLTPLHVSGAAHGSLHQQESLVPLIIAGTDEQPIYSRMVDLKEFILRVTTKHTS